MRGLGGFVLLAVSQQDGELEQAVETTAAEEFCRGCGVQARLHDRRATYVRDLLAAGRPVTLVWVKRVWRCVEPRCPVTWSETSTVIRPRASLTDRARVEACRRVRSDHHDAVRRQDNLATGLLDRRPERLTEGTYCHGQGSSRH